MALGWSSWDGGGGWGACGVRGEWDDPELSKGTVVIGTWVPCLGRPWEALEKEGRPMRALLGDRGQ